MFTPNHQHKSVYRLSATKQSAFGIRISN